MLFVASSSIIAGRLIDHYGSYTNNRSESTGNCEAFYEFLFILYCLPLPVKP